MQSARDSHNKNIHGAFTVVALIMLQARICQRMQTSGIRLWIVVAAWIAAASGSTAHANECLSDWGAAGEIVRREKLLTVQQLTQDEGPRDCRGRSLRPRCARTATITSIRWSSEPQASGQLKTIVVESPPASWRAAPAAIAPANVAVDL